ncbi:MAG: alpha/beta fold hydrolase [Planctomycetes bacterium]|nr:alpha/beta fold hydrolase [Planctomycetota bacterium]
MRTLGGVFVLLLALSAPAARASDPSANGSHLVRRADLPVTHADGSRSTLRVILPVDADRQHPTILFVHGLTASPSIYEGLAENLATRGYAVALFDQFPRASTDLEGWVRAARFSIDVLFRANVDPRSEVFDALDLDRLGAMGHSFGGMTTFGLAATDRRVKAAVALAPGARHLPTLLNYASTNPGVPLLVIAAQNDPIAVPGTFGRPAYDAIRHRHKQYVEIARGNHSNFSDLSLPLTLISPAKQRQISRRYANAWFDRHLRGLADPRGYTDGRHAAGDRDLSRRHAPAALPAGGVVASPTLNVRRGPGTSHAVVTTLNQGDAFAIVDERDGWYRVTWSGAPAGELWLSSYYVTPGAAPPAATTPPATTPPASAPPPSAPPSTAPVGTVTATELNVRRGPGTSNAVVTTLRRGAEVGILAEQAGWYRVTWPGAPAGDLWVSAAYVQR